MDAPIHRIGAVVPAFVAHPRTLDDLGRCLRALEACPPPEGGPDLRVIVVDDGSPLDLAPALAGLVRTRCVRQERAGPAAARNRGAREHGDAAEAVLFVDADVIVRPGAVRSLAHAVEDPGVAAAWGTVTAAIPEASRLTRYKNLVHRHFTLALGPEPRHLTSMIVLVRRAAFEAVGGFDVRWRGVSVEDVELGRDLVDAGWRLRFDPSVEVEHLHRFTPAAAVRNDLGKLRSHAGTTLRRLAARRPSVDAGGPGTARQARYVLGIPLGVGAVACLASGRPVPAAGLAVALALWERDLVRFLAAGEGPAFAASCLPFMVVERITAATAGALGAWDVARGVVPLRPVPAPGYRAPPALIERRIRRTSRTMTGASRRGFRRESAS